MCTFYESRFAIPNDPEQSYPILVTSRGLETLGQINPSLAKKCKETGRIIDSFQTYKGSKRIYFRDPDLAFGTSRSKVNLILYEEAKSNSLISLQFGFKLSHVDVEAKTLEFKNRSTQSTVSVSYENAKLIACDGVYSIVRQCLEKQCKEFKSTVIPWTNEYRVLFAKPGVTHPDLNQQVHYIFSGCNAATIDTQSEQPGPCVPVSYTHLTLLTTREV